MPFTPIGMLKFLKKVRTLNPAHAGPIVVHCRCVWGGARRPQEGYSLQWDNDQWVDIRVGRGAAGVA